MAKFPGSIMGALFIVFALLVGCGGDPSNLPTDTPSGSLDSGTCPSGACADAGLTVDVVSPTEGVSPPTDTGSPAPDVELCYGGGGTSCAGRPCQPDSFLPTCQSAASCHCALPSMEQMCGPGSMPECRTTVARLSSAQVLTCSPGGPNHCSVNTDRAWSLFRLHPDLTSHSPRESALWNEGFSRLHYSLRRTFWTTEEGAGNPSAYQWRWSEGCGFPRSSPILHHQNGWLQICLAESRSTSDSFGLPPGTDARMDCAGDLCEWNRRPETRAVAWSATLTFDIPDNFGFGQYCGATVRVYPPGATTPSQTTRVRSDCSSIVDPSTAR